MNIADLKQAKVISLGITDQVVIIVPNLLHERMLKGPKSQQYLDKLDELARMVQEL